MDMVHTILIETLAEQDKEETRKVLLESYEQYQHTFEDLDDWHSYYEAIKVSLDNPHIESVLVAKSEDQILGTLQIYGSSEHAYDRPELNIQGPIIRLLGVHPEARGKGIATELLKAGLDYARAQQAPSLYLHTSDKMADAIRLYERLGFQRDFDKQFQNRHVLVKCYRYDF